MQSSRLTRGAIRLSVLESRPGCLAPWLGLARAPSPRPSGQRGVGALRRGRAALALALAAVVARADSGAVALVGGVLAVGPAVAQHVQPDAVAVLAAQLTLRARRYSPEGCRREEQGNKAGLSLSLALPLASFLHI